MANYAFTPLPAPHAKILISAGRFAWGFWVSYRGPSLDALLAAGCITQLMHDRLRASKGRRVDAEGDKFVLTNRPTRAQPGRCTVVRLIRFDAGGEAKALALPGVAAYLAREAVPTESPVSDPAKHTRAVGRFQRVVTWFASEKLIVPDWAAIRSCIAVDERGGGAA